MAARLAALTGVTGFLGGQVGLALAAQGWRLRLLVRRDLADPRLRNLQPEIVRGDLADVEGLRRLCRGAQAIVHVAGVVKARRASHFRDVNTEGAGRLAAVARELAPDAAFVLVSSLAARAPQLSAYARSKRDGEHAVTEALGRAAWIVRPPAIYGPGDRATLGLFQAAAASPVLPVLRRELNIPLIHVYDAASAIATLAGIDGGGCVALCDGRLEGHRLGEIMTQAAAAVGRRVRLAIVPTLAVRALGVAGDLGGLLGATPMVTSGKIRELLHGGWGLQPGELAAGLPPPRFELAAGFRDTVAGYRAMEWLAGARR
ncbi:NAD(P)-dependent oxidoreductase [Caulobacter sp. S45]|uniref:NAD-dependent epimerase/dehydratase family protein n=1 Tax=Caulobacter sp. S45 TaxID=1641861 RepID=UPI001577647A|nr:NAD-dependent epimerase/dehydratase family protein [Caulobacter sp. S45]